MLLLLLLQYPHLLHGAIAASAPIWNFFGEVSATHAPHVLPKPGLETACYVVVKTADGCSTRQFMLMLSADAAQVHANVYVLGT
jgi:hypothetical protein